MAGLTSAPPCIDFSSPASSFDLAPCSRCIRLYSSSSIVALPGLKMNLNTIPEVSSSHLPVFATSKDHIRQNARVAKSYSSSKPCASYRRRQKWNTWKQAKIGEISSSGFLQVSASSKADDSLPSEMSLENALQILGVAEGASFEEILRAKNAILGKHRGDQEIAIQVEAAYDVLLMQSLMQRRAGKVVDNSVLYADVQKAKNISNTGGPQWFRDALSKSPVALETPSTTSLGTQTAVYAGLMVWTFASGVSSQTSPNANADVPGLIMAIGFGASLYFLRKQNVQLGKAAALTVASLVVGAVFGGGVESWLRVDLIPVLGISSPAIVVSEFVLVSLWLSSLYLR